MSSSIGELIVPIMNIGVAGGVLWWFMYMNHRQMEKFREALDDLSENVLLLTLALPSANDRIKREAARNLDRLDKRRPHEARRE